MNAVILIRGLIDARHNVKNTLMRLRLNKKNHLVLIKDTKGSQGMIKRVRDYVTWGKINEETLIKLIVKRGRLAGNKRVNEKDAAKFAKELTSGKWPVELKRVFRLSPPSKGFEKAGIKYSYPRGALGPRGEKINELIIKMI